MIMPPIFLPMGALALLTFLVLMIVPLRRFGSVRAGHVGPHDFKFGESAKVPGLVSIPNRNYMNLLELPILFYVLCLMLAVSQRADDTFVALAWGYVALRALHSLVHLTVNHILIRLSVFAGSNLVLLAMWVMFFLPLFR